MTCSLLSIALRIAADLHDQINVPATLAYRTEPRSYYVCRRPTRHRSLANLLLGSPRADCSWPARARCLDESRLRDSSWRGTVASHQQQQQPPRSLLPTLLSTETTSATSTRLPTAMPVMSLVVVLVLLGAGLRILSLSRRPRWRAHPSTEKKEKVVEIMKTRIFTSFFMFRWQYPQLTYYSDTMQCCTFFYLWYVMARHGNFSSFRLELGSLEKAPIYSWLSWKALASKMCLFSAAIQWNKITTTAANTTIS